MTDGGTIERLQTVLDPAKTAFFLDVDGTLLGFKTDPGAVVADHSLRLVLRNLADASDGALALVSGRAIADLDRIMAPLVLPAGGTHGADLRFADGNREVMEGAALDGVRGLLKGFVRSRPGLTIEDKGAAIAVHFRNAPSRSDDVARFLEDAIADRALMVQHGNMVAEVKSSKSDKGTAITAFMRSRPFAGRTPFFVGDDLTDEHGFRVVNALGGISAKVGSGAHKTVARYALPDCAAVIALLASLGGIRQRPT